MKNSLLPLENEARAAYDALPGKWFPDAVLRAKLVSQMLKADIPVRNILDGGGFFPSAFVFSSYFPGSAVTICGLYNDDIPAPFRASISFKHSDLTKLDFPDDSFDLVYLGEVIEHIYDITSCFTRVHRLLRPGGYLAITTPNLVSWFNRISIMLGRCPVNYHPSPFTYGAERNSLEQECGKDQASVALHHYHIRLFSLQRLIDYTEHMGFTIVRHSMINFSTPDRRFFRLRALLAYLLPENAREGIILIARKPLTEKGY